MAAIKIRNGLIYDGTLREPFRGDVLILDDRIAAVGHDLPDCHAQECIDAAGRTVCPAFVDIHRHTDIKPFTAWTGETELRQGIGTVISGNCGISLTPASLPYAQAQYAFDEPVLGPVCQDPPMRFRDYLNALEARPLPLNMAAMIGTGAVRISLKGFHDSPFSPEEMKQAQQIIADALDAGAPGISLGMMYLPECYTSADEYAEMLRPVGERHSLITVHIRGEGDSLVRSVAEIIGIAARAKCALEISHFKSCGVRNWRRDIHRAIRLIEEARQKGQDVSCDFYPYDGGSTALTTLLPPAFVKGDMDGTLRRLGTDKGVRAFRESTLLQYPDWDNNVLTVGWDRTVISGVIHAENRRFLGMTVTEAAERFGYEDAAALAAHLMHDEHGRTAIISMSMCQDDIDTVAQLPYACVISDAIYADTDTPHPRMFGAMPKMIREYVRERRLLSMQEAIHKMTGLPARRMALQGRGEIRPGAYADILMFDPDRFTDRATYAAPAQTAAGLDLMTVNGLKVIENDTPVCRSAGRCLRVKR